MRLDGHLLGLIPRLPVAFFFLNRLFFSQPPLPPVSDESLFFTSRPRTKDSTLIPLPIFRSDLGAASRRDGRKKHSTLTIAAYVLPPVM